MKRFAPFENYPLLETWMPCPTTSIIRKKYNQISILEILKMEFAENGIYFVLMRIREKKYKSSGRIMTIYFALFEIRWFHCFE